MGLLDTGGFDDPGTLGLLSFGARMSNAPGGFMRALGPSVLGALNDRGQAKQDIAKQAQEQLRMQLLQQQMMDAQAKRQQEAEAQQRAEQFREYVLQNPIDTAGAQRKALELGQMKPMDFVDSLKPKARELSKLEQMKAPDGKMVNVAFYKDGSHEVLPYGVKPDIVLQGLGNRMEVIDKNAVQGGQSFQFGQSPDSVADNAVAMRGQNMRDARDRETIAATTQGTAMGKIPVGYRLKADGTLEAIPGGPADIKAGEIGAKAEAKKNAQMQQAGSVLETLGDAKKLVGMNTAGVGSWLTWLPATDARNLSAKLETIKANLGFDRLQQMRDNSPTGGALGAVAVQELTALQSTVASLDQAQSPKQLREAIAKIERHYQNWLGVMDGKMPNDGKTGSFDGAPSEADIRNTALKYGMSVEQVKKQLGLK